MEFADLCNDPYFLLGLKRLHLAIPYTFAHIITLYLSICTIDLIYVDSPITILKGNATNCWIIPRINLEVYMFESNVSENIHVMVSLNCPYVLDIKIEVVQKFVPYDKFLFLFFFLLGFSLHNICTYVT